jgi:AbrB family looped-hinge helix DNA binding protein
MKSITLSSKYQIVIPKELRERMGLKPGQKFHALDYGDQIRLVPVRPIEELRGSARGIDTRVEREADRV